MWGKNSVYFRKLFSACVIFIILTILLSTYQTVWLKCITTNMCILALIKLRNFVNTSQGRFRIRGIRKIVVNANLINHNAILKVTFIVHGTRIFAHFNMSLIVTIKVTAMHAYLYSH